MHITSRYADIPEVSIDPEKLPKSLRELLPFAKEWAISDDLERDRFAQSKSPEEKRVFINAVWPRMPQIESYCSEYRDEVPVPDEVVLFDMLMEAAAEVHLEVHPD